MKGFNEVSSEEMYEIDGGITQSQVWGAIAVVAGIAAVAATGGVALVAAGVAAAAGAAAVVAG